jgi:hypothetical protein
MSRRPHNLPLDLRLSYSTEQLADMLLEEFPYGGSRVELETVKGAERTTSSDFPYRAVGKDVPKREVENYPTYICTVLAPKSLTPIAFYTDRNNRKIIGFSPDNSVWYTETSIDPAEASATGCTRVHMVPGLKERTLDRGKGLGTATYIACYKGQVRLLFFFTLP